MPIFDAHFHVIDPRFPLVPNQGFLPEPFTVDDYRASVAGLDVVGGAVVSGLLPGLRPDLPRRRAGAARAGVLRRGQRPVGHHATRRSSRWPRPACARTGSTCSAAATSTRSRSRRASMTWRAGIWRSISTPATCTELAPRLAVAPRLVIDHLGMSQAGLPALLELVKDGAYVKASGFGRIDVDPYSALRAIADAQPRGAAVRFRPARDPRAAPVRGRRPRARRRGRGRARAVRQRGRALPLTRRRGRRGRAARAGSSAAAARRAGGRGRSAGRSGCRSCRARGRRG